MALLATVALMAWIVLIRFRQFPRLSSCMPGLPDTFRTRVAHIFAAGDVIGYPSLAATSSEQGRLAACHAFGVEAGPMAPHFPIGIYAIPEISMVGATEHELTDGGR